MRNDSVTSRETPPAHPVRARETHARQEPTRGREEVQRFRKLMDGPAKDASQETSVGVSGGQRGPASSEQEQALRELLQRQLDAAAEHAPGVPPRGEERDGQDSSSDGGSSGDQSLPTAGAQAWHQAQQIVMHGAEQPAPAAQAALAPALAELIERHVKQLLVPDTHSSAQSREIMITLKDGVLPGAELWLSRTDKGWKLRVDTHTPESYRQLLEGAPQLVERFAEKHLGELEIDPVWHG
jgi:hypothetical protein